KVTGTACRDDSNPQSASAKDRPPPQRSAKAVAHMAGDRNGIRGPRSRTAPGRLAVCQNDRLFTLTLGRADRLLIYLRRQSGRFKDEPGNQISALARLAPWPSPSVAL